jgi:LMBR1 domain-containing protein 1
MAGLLTFVGWFLFVCYGGIGLIAIPLDFVNAFKHRPRLLTKNAARNQRKGIMDQAADLISKGEALAGDMIAHREGGTHGWRALRKRKREEAFEINRYRVLVEALEHDYERYEQCNPDNFRKHYNPLAPFLYFFGALFSALLSLAWILHIILYTLMDPPVTPFLNDMFTWFDSWFGLLGTIFVGVFAMYLLIAGIKGAWKFGTRFFLIKIRPMEVKKTLINSFLFNVALVLLIVMPVVQFTMAAFNMYARLTDADLIFGAQIKYLKFFRYFFANHVFIYALLGMSFLTLVYLSLCPSDRAYLKKVRQGIQKRTKESIEMGERKLEVRAAHEWK